MSSYDQETRFSRLLRHHYRRLFAYVYAIVRSYPDAEDVIQQASLVLWEKFDDYKPETDFFPWACSVARLEAMHFLRQQRRYRAHFSEAFQLRLAVAMAGIPADVAAVRVSALEDCVENLPGAQRELLQQCFGGSKTVAMIAQETGRTTHSIYSSLRNIRNKLLDCVDQSVFRSCRKMNRFDAMSPDFQSLLSTACCEEAVQDQMAQLEELVDTESTMRLLIDYLQLDGELHRIIRQRASEDRCLEMFRSDAPADRQTAQRSRPPSPTVPFLAAPLRNTLGYFSEGLPLAYLLATVVTGLGLLIGSMIPASHPEQVAHNSAPAIAEPTAYVGRITGMADCKWETKGLGIRDWGLESGNQKSEIRNQGSLVALGDRFSLASGLMEITYNTGAKVILQGPVTYSVETNGGYLAVGKLTGKLEKKEAGGQWPVASADKGLGTRGSGLALAASSSLATDHRPLTTSSNPFVIHTPAASITDLGTEFGVKVEPSGVTETSVFQGKVKLVENGADAKSSGGGCETLLIAGQGLRESIRRHGGHPGDSYK